jgi:hypothetical protein
MIRSKRTPNASNDVSQRLSRSYLPVAKILGHSKLIKRVKSKFGRRLHLAANSKLPCGGNDFLVAACYTWVIKDDWKFNLENIIKHDGN